MSRLVQLPSTVPDLAGKLLLCTEEIAMYPKEIPRNTIIMCLKDTRGGVRRTLTFFLNSQKVEKSFWGDKELNNFFILIQPKPVLTGKKICITGELDHPRDVYKQLIELFDGKLSSSVTYDTNYLVTDEKTQTTKMRAAKDRGIPVISSTQLFNMFQE